MSEDKQNLKVSSVADVKQRVEKNKQGEAIELPSGLVFSVGRPSLVGLLTGNAIPSRLSAIALKIMNGGISQVKSIEDMKNTFELIDKVVVASVLAPKVVSENASDEEILVSDLSEDDKIAIFTFVQSGEAGLEKFRRQLTGGQSRPDMPQVSRDEAKSVS